MAAAGFAPLKSSHQRSAQCRPLAAFPSSPFPLFLFLFFFLSFLFLLPPPPLWRRHSRPARPTEPHQCLPSTGGSCSPRLGSDELTGMPPGPNQYTRASLAPVQRRADRWPSPQLPNHSNGRSGRVAWIGRGSPAPFPSSVSLSREAGQPKHGCAPPNRGSAKGHPHPSHPPSPSLTRGRAPPSHGSTEGHPHPSHPLSPSLFLSHFLSQVTWPRHGRAPPSHGSTDDHPHPFHPVSLSPSLYLSNSLSRRQRKGRRLTGDQMAWKRG